MLDLETLSTRGHAAILVIAAIKFDRGDNLPKIDESDKFYAKISLDSCHSVGLHIDKQTIKWWDEQDPVVRKEVFSEPREDLETVLTRFKTWYSNADKIWSNGATFDIPILAEAYARCKMEPPWKFWLARDTRTLYDLAGVTQKDLPAGNLHHALHDCWRQIWGVKESLKRIRTGYHKIN